MNMKDKDDHAIRQDIHTFQYNCCCFCLSLCTIVSNKKTLKSKSPKSFASKIVWTCTSWGYDSYKSIFIHASLISSSGLRLFRSMEANTASPFGICFSGKGINQKYKTKKPGHSRSQAFLSLKINPLIFTSRSIFQASPSSHLFLSAYVRTKQFFLHSIS